MSGIVVVGAGGRVGRAVVAEAVRRGHEVTAGVRSSERHTDLAGEGVRVLRVDAVDPASVREAARGRGALVSTVYDQGSDPSVFFPANARALVEGAAGAVRLVHVGLAPLLPTAAGTPLMDEPGYPDHRAFFAAHAAALEVLSGSGAADWVALSPAGDFDRESAPTGRYRVAPGAADSTITAEDFALAVLDEIEDPRHHRVHIGVEGVR
ncbi:NAD(P)-dependent oxidoreductase [Nocardiopsis changdeensis]|uniref:NAD(P)-dependent oxidoreductase n=1 Tax=Nocardiopsis changdeensis TaxID=2831969 RepID=UPI003F452B0B